MNEAESLLAVLSILSDANTASHFNASGLIQALDAWLHQQQTLNLAELRTRIGDLVSALSPNALAILQSLMHDMLRSSCQHAFAGTSFGRADVLICADAIEARQIAVQLALRKRYPLLVSDGLKAVTRPPVIYGDQNMLEDLHECAWSAMLTADSFCTVPRIKRDIHSELSHRAQFNDTVNSDGTLPTELIDLSCMDVAQLESEIVQDLTRGSLPTAVVLMAGGDRNMGHTVELAREMDELQSQPIDQSSVDVRHVLRHARHQQHVQIAGVECNASWWHDEVEDIRAVCDRHNLWCHVEGSLLPLASASDRFHEGLHAPVVLSCADSFTLQPLRNLGLGSSLALLVVRDVMSESQETALPPSSTDLERCCLRIVDSICMWWLAFQSRPHVRAGDWWKSEVPKAKPNGVLSTAIGALIDEHVDTDKITAESGETKPYLVYDPTLVAASEDVLVMTQYFRAALSNATAFKAVFGTSPLLLPHMLAFRVYEPTRSTPSLPNAFGLPDSTSFQYMLEAALQSQCRPLHLSCESVPSTMAASANIETAFKPAAQPRRMDSSVFQSEISLPNPLARTAGWFVYRPAMWLVESLSEHSYFDQQRRCIDEFVAALSEHVHMLNRIRLLRPHFSRVLIKTSSEFEHIPTELIKPVAGKLIGLGGFRCVPQLLAVKPAITHPDAQPNATELATSIESDPILDEFNTALAQHLHKSNPEVYFETRTISGAVCIGVAIQSDFPISSDTNPQPSAAELEAMKKIAASCSRQASTLELPPTVARALETALQRGIREAQVRLNKPSANAPLLSRLAPTKLVASVWSWLSDSDTNQADATKEKIASPGQHFDIRFGFEAPIVKPIPSLKAVLFDLDGTLCDTDQLHYIAWRDELQSSSAIALTHEQYKSRISGKPNVLIAADMLPHLTVSQREVVCAQKETRFRELAVGGLQPLPGLLDFLVQLQSLKIRTACVTNAPRRNAEFMLTQLGLSFSCLIIGEECTASKPSPAPYLEAANRLGVQMSECVVFEDSGSGIQAGVAADAGLVIGLCTTHVDSALLAMGAHASLNDFADIDVELMWTQRHANSQTS